MTKQEKLDQIKKIAQGMYDWWINKSPYTDVYNLAEHLLETELRRILRIFDEEY